MNANLREFIYVRSPAANNTFIIRFAFISVNWRSFAVKFF